MRAWIAACLAFAMAASVARAEVRVSVAPDGTSSLVVQPVARGVWTPKNGSTSQAINPTGDLVGDGYPSFAARDHSLVVAWAHPSGASITVLRAESGASALVQSIPAGELIGSPQVTSAGGAWLLGWTTADPGPAVHVAAAGGAVVTSPVTLGPGRLVGLVSLDSAVLVLRFEPASGTLDVDRIPFFHDSEPTPIPIPVAVIDLGGVVPGLRDAARGPQLGVHPAVAGADGFARCLDVRADAVVLAWPTSDGLLGRLVVDASGVLDGPTYVPGPSGNCVAILNATKR